MLDDNVLNKSFFTGEAWFHLSGYINKQAMRIWSSENPHVIVEEPLHPQKIGVWIGVSRRRLIGPIFFQNTINAIRYQTNLLRPFIDQLHDDELREGCFQQDRQHIPLTQLKPYYMNILIIVLSIFYLVLLI